ncbi:hypothetical protein [Luteimonas sp. R10]|uniref:hypothetical protein n=1 Tax=Luteimonas sp. R10 TaxID=3108176 RepID=UPI003088AFCA|nr:hypothetical protein U3649_13395 [Luteimonas sp. R10]
MPSNLSLLVTSALSIFLLNCQNVTTRGNTGSLPSPSWTASAVEDEGTHVAQDLDRIKEIAIAKDIVANHGSNFIYIDGPSEGRYVIVHETFSSRSKYKTITPIVSVEQDDLIIDCSYVKSITDMTTVSVGTYCRGRSEASIESIEHAISDEHLLTYSSSLPWLGETSNSADCEHPSGLAYAGHYIVRCRTGEDDEMTGNLSITFLSPDYRVIFSIAGFEFAPTTAEANQKTLTFWGLNKSSHHEIAVKTLP